MQKYIFIYIFLVAYVVYYGRDIKDPGGGIVGNCQYFFLITEKYIYC